MNTTSVKTTWTGWYRLPGQQWQSVVTGSTEDEAWRRLRQHVEQLEARFVDSFVGASGIDPNAAPKMRRRRF